MPLQVPARRAVLRNRFETFIARLRQLSLQAAQAAQTADEISNRPIANLAEGRAAIQDLANVVQGLLNGLSEYMNKTADLYETLEKIIKRG
jgi:hypothetical protein